MSCIHCDHADPLVDYGQGHICDNMLTICTAHRTTAPSTPEPPEVETLRHVSKTTQPIDPIHTHVRLAARYALTRLTEQQQEIERLRRTVEYREREIEATRKCYDRLYRALGHTEANDDEAPATAARLTRERDEAVWLLEEDASGEPVPELLRRAASILRERGDGPLVDRLLLMADQIDAFLAKVKRPEQPSECPDCGSTKSPHGCVRGWVARPEQPTKEEQG
jgi:hypothetical protein